MHRLRGDFDQSGVKHVIGQCDLFIGSRMHACIAALSQNVPTVGIAYSRKFAGVFETVGVADMVLEARELTQDSLIDQCLRQYRSREQGAALLMERTSEAKTQLRQIFRALLSNSAKSAAATNMAGSPEAAVQ